MEIEFLDPGPNQPDGPAPGARGPTAARRPRPDRETVGLLVMLTAAAALPVVAAFQLVFTVQQQDAGGSGFTYGADAWGRIRLGDGSALATAQHEPRFGILLAVCGAAFGVLALTVAAQLLLRTALGRRPLGATVAGAAGVLAGLLVGITASMALEVESVFDRLRAEPADPFGAGPAGIRLEVGPAVWLGLAAVLAGGLSVAAALRVHRVDRLPHTGITSAAAGY